MWEECGEPRRAAEADELRKVSARGVGCSTLRLEVTDRWGEVRLEDPSAMRLAMPHSGPSQLVARRSSAMYGGGIALLRLSREIEPLMPLTCGLLVWLTPMVEERVRNTLPPILLDTREDSNTRLRVVSKFAVSSGWRPFSGEIGVLATNSVKGACKYSADMCTLPPAGVNLSALDNRFLMTWLNLLESMLA